MNGVRFTVYAIFLLVYILLVADFLEISATKMRFFQKKFLFCFLENISLFLIKSVLKKFNQN